jgi:hypothetical protein
MFNNSGDYYNDNDFYDDNNDHGNHFESNHNGIIIITIIIIPVIIRATGTISNAFRKYVSNIKGNHEVKELQKTAILGTAHIIRKVLT